MVEAKTKLLSNVDNLKRAQSAAARLAELVPPGGRPGKVRRTVTHLSEVLLLGSSAAVVSVAGDVCRSGMVEGCIYRSHDQK